MTKADILAQLKKSEAFGEIAKLYYEYNFGTTSKGEIDLLMFKLFWDAAKQAARTAEGSVNEAEISPYKIGCMLGLTPARVRNLQLKLELRYPDNATDWRAEMADILADPRNMQKNGAYIQVTIRSQSLFNAIEDWIEDSGGSVDLTLNSKVLRLRKEHFIDLIEEVFQHDPQWKAVKKELLRKAKKKQLNGEKLSQVLGGAAELAPLLTTGIPSVGTALAGGAAITRVLTSLLEMIQEKEN